MVLLMLLYHMYGGGWRQISYPGDEVDLLLPAIDVFWGYMRQDKLIYGILYS